MKLLIIILNIGLLRGINNNKQHVLTDEIRTDKGIVQGRILKTMLNRKKYSSFQGIPYAEPPLDYLRFKPPIEKSEWTGVLQTTVEGSVCPQNDFIYHNYVGNEDCLYLNIYTPETNFNKILSDLKPVMIWIYGGAFTTGYGNSSFYGPDFIVEDDVVLVTFNYRLGALGFLSLNHENATGNVGLKDQNLVLRWVKRNIDKFGGNPDMVTIFGQSAGGVGTDLHVLSEMSKGLFHKAISMSASPLCPWAFFTPKNSEEKAFALGRKLGIFTSNKSELLSKLYEVPATKLVEKTEELRFLLPPIGPTIEKSDIALNEQKFLTECPYNKYKTGNYLKVPYLTGFVTDETLLFTRDVDNVADYGRSVIEFIEDSISPIPIIGPILSTITRLITDLIRSIFMEIIKLTSYVFFISGLNIKREYLQKNSDQPVYFYHFAYNNHRNLHQLLNDIKFDGVAHGDDLAYIFYISLTNFSSHNPEDPTFNTRLRMSKMWTNFAKYSNPTPNDESQDLLQQVNWLPTGDSDNYLDIDKDLSQKIDPKDIVLVIYQFIDEFFLSSRTGCTNN